MLLPKRKLSFPTHILFFGTSKLLLDWPYVSGKMDISVFYPPPRFPSLFKKPLFFWEGRVFINPSDFCPFEAESFKVFSTWQPWRPRWRPRPFYPLGVGFGNIFIFNRGWSWDFSSEIWLFLFLLGLVFVRKNGWQLKNWHTFPHVFFWGVWGWG